MHRATYAHTYLLARVGSVSRQVLVIKPDLSIYSFFRVSIERSFQSL